MVAQTRTDFVRQLQSQLGYLERSAEMYDQGHEDEAIRLATTLRVLFHNTPSSTSLIHHLQVTQIRLLSSHVRVPSTGAFEANITNVELSVAPFYMRFKPILDGSQIPPDDHGRRPSIVQVQVPWRKWWNDETIYRVDTVRYTRWDIIRGAANQDGGAHIDAEITRKYFAAKQGLTWGMELKPDNGDPPVNITATYAPHAALRHMAYEVLRSNDIRAIQ